MNRVVVIIATLAVAAITMIGGARAGDQDDTEQHCDGSTYEVVECLKAKTAEWDKRMNAAYQQALEDAAPKQREQLRAAQRLWAQYRDANCLYYDLGEGTIARIDAGYCTNDMTESRARELEQKTERH